MTNIHSDQTLIGTTVTARGNRNIDDRLLFNLGQRTAFELQGQITVCPLAMLRSDAYCLVLFKEIFEINQLNFNRFE